MRNKNENVSLKKLALNGVIRALIVGAFMGMGLYFEYKKNDPKNFNSLLASTIIAVSISLFSVIYEYDVISTKKKIIIHTICMFFTVIPALIISGWYNLSSIRGYIIMVVSFIAFGVVACSIGYLISKYILKNVPKYK